MPELENALWLRESENIIREQLFQLLNFFYSGFRYHATRLSYET